MVTPALPHGGHVTACKSVRRDAFAAFDGELSPDALREIEAHHAHCSACRERFIADVVFLRAVRRAASLDTAPRSLRDRVALALHARAAEVTPA